MDYNYLESLEERFEQRNGRSPRGRNRFHSPDDDAFRGRKSRFGSREQRRKSRRTELSDDRF